MKSSQFKVIIVLLFLAALILPILAADKVGGAISPNENRYLAKFPTVFDQNNKLAPGLKEGFESWLKDNLAGREGAQKAKAYIDFKLFASSPSPLVHIGKDGWYFYTGDHDLEIGLGTHLLSNEELEAIRENQVAIQSSLKEQGVDYVLVLIPSKTSVYPEYINGSINQGGITLIDQVTTYLRENTTIPVINVKPAPIDAKKEQDVYFRSDTHWNYVGAYEGYKAIINGLNELGMIQSQPASIATQPTMRKGDLSGMMGYPGLTSPEPFDTTVIVNPQASLVNESEEINQVTKLLGDKQMIGKHFSFSNPSAEKSALILGDSFFFTWGIPELFAENFAEMNFIRKDLFVSDIFPIVNPDILILESTERIIYSLQYPDNEKLLFPQKQGFSAEIVSHTTPTSMERGRSYDITVIVRNTGEQPWSEDSRVSVSLFQNGIDTGYRVYLTDGMTVESGGEVSFIIENFQASEPGNTYLEFQMVKEENNFFGEKARVDIVVK